MLPGQKRRKQQLIRVEPDGTGELQHQRPVLELQRRAGGFSLREPCLELPSLLQSWLRSAQSWRGWKQKAQDPSNEFTQPLEYQVFVFLRVERRIKSGAPSWAAQLACPRLVWAPKELALIKSLFAPEAWVPTAF